MYPRRRRRNRSIQSARRAYERHGWELLGRLWPGWTEEAGPRAISAAELETLAGGNELPPIAAIAWQMTVDGELRQAAVLGTTKVRRLALRAAIRPGDSVSLRSTVTAAAPLADTPDHGTVEVRHSLLDATGAVVLEIDSSCLMQRRPADVRSLRAS